MCAMTLSNGSALIHGFSPICSTDKVDARRTRTTLLIDRFVCCYISHPSTEERLIASKWLTRICSHIRNIIDLNQIQPKRIRPPILTYTRGASPQQGSHARITHEMGLLMEMPTTAQNPMDIIIKNSCVPSSRSVPVYVAFTGELARQKTGLTMQLHTYMNFYTGILLQKKEQIN